MLWRWQYNAVQSKSLKRKCEWASEKETEVYEFCDKHEMLVGQNSALKVKSIKGSAFRTICTLNQYNSSDVDLMKQTNYK